MPTNHMLPAQPDTSYQMPMPLVVVKSCPRLPVCITLARRFIFIFLALIPIQRARLEKFNKILHINALNLNFYAER